MGCFPKNSGPRIMDRIGWLKVWNIRSVREGAFLNPMVFFGDTLVVDNDSGSPQ